MIFELNSAAQHRESSNERELSNIKISEAERNVNVKFSSRPFIGSDIGIGVIIWDFRLRISLTTGRSTQMLTTGRIPKL